MIAVLVGIMAIPVTLALVKGKKMDKKNPPVDDGFTGVPIKNIKYTCGHPAIDYPGQYMLRFKEGNIHICTALKKELGVIPGDKIKDITVEDETTFKDKVTLGRIALVGVFAFAIPKKKKVELAYLTISWNDGRFDHNTIFEYEGFAALMSANTHRNNIIKEITKTVPQIN
ncbi:MAG: hypothetical protein EOM05_12010 [Clostridia bacterium]|nr:hypothetical protein [Clostridia bacterium]